MNCCRRVRDNKSLARQVAVFLSARALPFPPPIFSNSVMVSSLTQMPKPRKHAMHSRPLTLPTPRSQCVTRRWPNDLCRPWNRLPFHSSSNLFISKLDFEHHDGAVFLRAILGRDERVWQVGESNAKRTGCLKARGGSCIFTPPPHARAYSDASRPSSKATPPLKPLPGLLRAKGTFVPSLHTTPSERFL